jgi:hypothetical protein
MLSVLSENEREIVISLPYRVGLWIGASDSTGGDDSNTQEKQALESIISGFTQDVFGSELVQHIMSSTMSQKDRWEVWAENVADVPQDCEKAIHSLKNFFDEKEVSAFKQRLLEIAEAVALAFREYEEFNFIQKLQVNVLYFFSKFNTSFRQNENNSKNRFLNISLQERRALYTLADILDIKHRL